jgi:hypothetical protein
MTYQKLVGAIALAVALSVTSLGAQGFDDTKYPNLKGRWTRFIVRGVSGQPSFDQTKPWGAGQQAPLTPKYQAVLEASLADQAKGGAGNNPGNGCLPYGMPYMTYGFYPLEYVPDTTYVLINHVDHGRRIFTDGRERPKDIEPTFAGYSIGKWIDEDGDGRYDVLEVETRGFKGPRVYDATGLPLHQDNQSIFRERIYLDKADRNILHDEITVIDHALTRPWTVDKKFVRKSDPQPVWPEFICSEDNALITIGKENYMVSGEGELMPIRKDQPPPNMRYFQQPQK